MMAQPARRSGATGQASAAEPARKGASDPPASAAVNSSAEPASGSGQLRQQNRRAGQGQQHTTRGDPPVQDQGKPRGGRADRSARLHGAFPWRAPSERGVGVRGRQP